MPLTHDFLHGPDLHWLVLCDHASRRLPPELGDLGLAEADRRRHIAWDIGAADLARRLARHLRAPCFLHRYSRLVIDPNRHVDDPTSILAMSDGSLVPGNREIDAGERERRRRRYYQPYHTAIARHLDRLARLSLAPMLVAVHSFTPELDGVPRPWPVGVLWKDDPGLAHRLIRELSRDGTHVGDNQPYDGHYSLGHTLQAHAIERGLPQALIEVRQDLLGSPARRAAWALKLFRALRAVQRPA